MREEERGIKTRLKQGKEKKSGRRIERIRGEERKESGLRQEKRRKDRERREKEVRKRIRRMKKRKWSKTGQRRSESEEK